jgi:DNA-binding NarL/FixJ family response regulator
LKSANLLLSTNPQITVVGEAHSGAEALVKNEGLAPDLVLMDLIMPGMNGLEATRRIKIGKSPPLIIILTLYDNAEYRNAAMTVGADGFVAKSEAGTQLHPLIRELFADEVPAQQPSGGTSNTSAECERLP